MMLDQLKKLTAIIVSSCASVFLTLSAARADIFAQGPCEYVNSVCLTFDSQTSPIPVLRAYEFAIPVAGKALVRFDGTMQCIVSSDAGGRDVIDFVSQIVNRTEDEPSHTSPGGARFAMRLHPNEAFDDASNAVNLSSSRLITYGNPGIAKVYFKIAPLRMDPGAFCNVLSAAFSVTTFP